MGGSVSREIKVGLLCLAPLLAFSVTEVDTDQRLELKGQSGIRVVVDEASNGKALKVLLPDEVNDEAGILVLFPEHVTARRSGAETAEPLYLSAAREASAPSWRRSAQWLEYKRELPRNIQMTARATIEDDGIRFRYEFSNRSKTNYDMIYAVTDPRLRSPYFRDVRLERTYVHHADGFDLLASESPERLTEDLSKWLPNRYRASYTWPIPKDRIEKQPDGVTWHNKSRPVDEPFIATKSTDGKWIVATFAFSSGNVWSNPELTCQHTDPEVALRAGGSAAYEVKMLVIRSGSLDEVLTKVREQRSRLSH